MNKRIIFVVSIMILLLVAATVAFWFHYRDSTSSTTQSYTVQHVYTWFVDSHLIDPKEPVKRMGEQKKEKIVEQLKLQSGLTITWYSYNYEKDMMKKEVERKHSSKLLPPEPGMEFASRNLSVFLPEGTGNPKDFESVLNAKKAIPGLIKTYASKKAKVAVEAIHQKKSFVTVADAFNEIGSSDAAAQTFSHYLKEKTVTWSGQVIGFDSSGVLYVHGKPSTYKGQEVKMFENVSEITNPSLIRYVFTVDPKEKKEFASLKTGDTVSIKGQLFTYGYQSEQPISKWFLQKGVLISHKQPEDVYTYIDPQQAFEWFQKSSLTMVADNPVFSQTIENKKPVTHLESLFVRITSYTYNREKEVGTTEFVEKDGGKEFTVQNLTVWVPYGVENADAFKQVLQARKSKTFSYDKQTTVSPDIRQFARNMYVNREFKPFVDSFYQLDPVKQEAVFHSYVKGKNVHWKGTVVSVETDRLLVYGMTSVYQANNATKKYLFSVRLPQLRSTSKYKVGDTVIASGFVSHYTNKDLTTIWEVSESEVVQQQK